jgi:hypothetical protein
MLESALLAFDLRIEEGLWRKIGSHKNVCIVRGSWITPCCRFMYVENCLICISTVCTDKFQFPFVPWCLEVISSGYCYLKLVCGGQGLPVVWHFYSDEFVPSEQKKFVHPSSDVPP